MGELRQGAVEGLMVEAVAKAADIALDEVRRAVMVVGDLAAVAEAALAGGGAGLGQFAIQLFRPIRPMLAGAATDTEEALAELGEAAFEFKLDARACRSTRLARTYVCSPRRLNDVTHSVPDIVEVVRALPAAELILDGEALSFQPDGQPQPFQVTMRRFGRKLDIAAARTSLPLRPSSSTASGSTARI